MVVFTTLKNLECLSTVDTILVDGTFDYCTKFFKQLFTIHALANKHYVPVAFCLLADKKKASYEKVFKYMLFFDFLLTDNLKSDTNVLKL